MINRVTYNICVVLVAIFGYVSGEELPTSHRHIVYTLSDSLVRKIISETTLPSKLTILFDNNATSEFVRPAVLQALIGNNVALYQQRNAADTTLELSVQKLSVQFGDVFSDSFFGSRKSQRTVKLICDITVSSQNSGKIILARSYEIAYSDTVRYTEIESLRDMSIPFTSYTEPALSFFDSILEPAIIIVASGTAIYLFFTIRS